MRRELKEKLTRRIPAWFKVLVTQFGASAVLRAAVLLLACFVLVLVTVALRLGWLLTGAGLVFEGWLFWRVRAFQLVGQILCACGCVRENLSQFRQAKNRFLAAL